jgi:signal peptide peptidase SppA
MNTIPPGLYMCLESALHELLRPVPEQALRSARNEPEGPYMVTDDSVAVIPITGFMMQNEAWWGGGTSTVKTARAFNEAAIDPNVKAGFIPVNSGGGQAIGTAELHDAVAAFAKVKPLHAHIAGIGASAAVYAIAGAGRITASRDSEVGSIGTLLALQDTSGMAEKAGVQVIVLKTAEHKGGVIFGAPITEEMIAGEQERLEDFNALFMNAVKKGRGFSKAQMDAVSTGRMWIAEKAQALGLVDGVMSQEQAYQQLTKGLKTERRDKASLRMLESRLTK